MAGVFVVLLCVWSRLPSRVGWWGVVIGGGVVGFLAGVVYDVADGRVGVLVPHWEWFGWDCGW